MPDGAQFDRLLGTLAALAERNAAGPILVEGRRDQHALKRLGCAGDLVCIHNGEPVARTVARLAADGREVIILTDWDRKGRILRDQLATLLTAEGVRVDITFHDTIPTCAAVAFKDVESLATYVERNLERYHRTTLEEHVAARTA